MDRSIKKNEGKTIQELVKQGLCTGCGTCIAVCPKNALTVMECSKSGTYIPRLDDTKCSQCGICLGICPGAEVNSKELNLLAFNEEPKNALVGNYLNCYAGYATDQQLRYESTSGGLVTALSVFALETGAVDGVLVTRMTRETPLKPQPFIARSKEEVMTAIGSKYCPVSADVALKEILEKKGRYIVVGLPCHIQGLRKAQVLNEKLRDRVSYCFGLVCHHTPSFYATKYLLSRFKVPEEKVAKLDYRGKGWPSGMDITLRDGSEIFIPLFSSHYQGMVFQRFFWPIRCMVCDDKLCQLADIIFMDPHLPEFRASEKIGASLLMVRSKRGEALVEKAMKNKVVELKAISIRSVVDSQDIERYIRQVAARRFISKLPIKSKFPLNESATKPTITDFLEAFHLKLMSILCQNSSRFSQLVIGYHVFFFDLGRSMKKVLR